jgi:hypothetical protein
VITIYHYNDKKLNELLNKKKQEELGLIEVSEQEKKEKEGRSIVYNDFYSSIEQISFFFDPLPTDLVVKELYKNPMYQKGNILYEHKVNVEKLNLKAWQVVESPIKTSMLDSWTLDGKELWADKVTALEEIYGDRGRSVEGLIKSILRYKGKTRSYYEASFKNVNFTDENRSQYAAMVPHLYIYPINGKIIPYDVKEIKL